MDSLTGLSHLKKNPQKWAMAVKYANGDMFRIIEVAPFANLPNDIFQVICSFRSCDWVCYNSMKEQEYFFNRDEEDIPEDKRSDSYDKTDRELLTEAQFKKVLENNPSKVVSYALYSLMSPLDSTNQ
jgi:hypothetical protein